MLIAMLIELCPKRPRVERVKSISRAISMHSAQTATSREGMRGLTSGGEDRRAQRKTNKSRGETARRTAWRRQTGRQAGDLQIDSQPVPLVSRLAV